MKRTSIHRKDLFPGLLQRIELEIFLPCSIPTGRNQPLQTGFWHLWLEFLTTSFLGGNQRELSAAVATPEKLPYTHSHTGTSRLLVAAEYRENSGDEKNDCHKKQDEMPGNGSVFTIVQRNWLLAVLVMRAVQRRNVRKRTEAPYHFLLC